MLWATSDFAFPVGNIFNLNSRRAFLSTCRQQLWARELLRSCEAVSCPVSDGLLTGQFQQCLVGRPQGWDLRESCDVLAGLPGDLIQNTAPPFAYFFISKMGITRLRPWRCYYKKQSRGATAVVTVVAADWEGALGSNQNMDVLSKFL